MTRTTGKRYGFAYEVTDCFHEKGFQPVEFNSLVIQQWSKRKLTVCKLSHKVFIKYHDNGACCLYMVYRQGNVHSIRNFMLVLNLFILLLLLQVVLSNCHEILYNNHLL